MADTVSCQRCKSPNPALSRAPFRSELGERIHESICQICWQEWLEHQTLLINHYGLDPRDRKARDFLYGQIEEVLLGGGEGEEIDTSKKGTIGW